MLYNFITSEDLRVAIKDEFLTQVQPDNAAIAKAEATAISYIKDFLTNRYLVADIFPEIRAWNATSPYKVAVPVPFTDYDVVGNPIETTITPVYYRDTQNRIQNVVWFNNKYYVAITDSTNLAPSTNPSAWIESDPRDQKMVHFVVAIALMYLHQRINPRKIPENRIDSYNQAKEWLLMVKDGDITPDLPRNLDRQQNVDTIPWGSNRQQKHIY